MDWRHASKASHPAYAYPKHPTLSLPSTPRSLIAPANQPTPGGSIARGRANSGPD